MYQESVWRNRASLDATGTPRNAAFQAAGQPALVVAAAEFCSSSSLSFAATLSLLCGESVEGRTLKLNGEGLNTANGGTLPRCRYGERRSIRQELSAWRV